MPLHVVHEDDDENNKNQNSYNGASVGNGVIWHERIDPVTGLWVYTLHDDVVEERRKSSKRWEEDEGKGFMHLMRHSVSLIVGDVDDVNEDFQSDHVLETYEKGIESRHDEHGLGIWIEGHDEDDHHEKWKMEIIDLDEEPHYMDSGSTKDESNVKTDDDNKNINNAPAIKVTKSDNINEEVDNEDINRKLKSEHFSGAGKFGVRLSQEYQTQNTVSSWWVMLGGDDNKNVNNLRDVTLLPGSKTDSNVFGKKDEDGASKWSTWWRRKSSVFGLSALDTQLEWLREGVLWDQWEWHVKGDSIGEKEDLLLKWVEKESEQRRIMA